MDESTIILPYSAQKSSIFNQYFVKILWTWITGAFSIHLLTLFLRRTRPSHILRALLRYTLITSVWIFTTQWFFGPPLIDRSFLFTGGACELVRTGALEDEPAKELFTAAACKIAGGNWAGGHDISGHTFILVLGSVFLMVEAWPAFLALWERQKPAQPVGKKVDVKQGDVIRAEQEDRSLWVASLAVMSGVAGLALWMLAHTVLYWHTWREKVSGLVVAMAGLGLVYVLPAYVPLFGALVGRPSI